MFRFAKYSLKVSRDFIWFKLSSLEMKKHSSMVPKGKSIEILEAPSSKSEASLIVIRGRRFFVSAVERSASVFLPWLRISKFHIEPQKALIRESRSIDLSNVSWSVWRGKGQKAWLRL